MDYSSSTKNLREIDINSLNSNNNANIHTIVHKIEDEHPTLNLSFNHFYKGIEAKKKVDIGRENNSLAAKEN